MDIKDTIDTVRNLPECNGKVALLGYCLGALMVFMTAARNACSETGNRKPERCGVLETAIRCAEVMVDFRRHSSIPSRRISCMSVVRLS